MAKGLDKVNRGWLKRQVAAGKMSGEVNYRFTDDYAYDNATNAGRTAILPARIRNPHRDDEGNWNDDLLPGHLNLDADDFTTRTGMAYKGLNGSIRLSIFSGYLVTLYPKAV